MKGWVTYVFGAFGLIVIIIGIFFGRDIFDMAYTFHEWHLQMKAGEKFMDSMTEKDFQIWMERTQKYLQQDSPKDWTIGAKPIPLELRQLKILRIDEGPNQVDYVWMGGMDHTELEVERKTDGSFQFTAMYNDESNRVIWPK